MCGNEEVSKGQRVIKFQDISDCKEAAQQYDVNNNMRQHCDIAVPQVNHSTYPEYSCHSYIFVLFFVFDSMMHSREMSLTLIHHNMIRVNALHSIEAWMPCCPLNTNETYLPKDFDIFSLSTAGSNDNEHGPYCMSAGLRRCCSMNEQ